MTTGQCRSCRAPIIWLTIRPLGRRMPIDTEPAPDGNIIADLTQAVGVVIPNAALPQMRADTPDEPFYRSHFATCPDANRWRRR
jgi:hypothetical protein